MGWGFLSPLLPAVSVFVLLCFFFRLFVFTSGVLGAICFIVACIRSAEFGPEEAAAPLEQLPRIHIFF